MKNYRKLCIIYKTTHQVLQSEQNDYMNHVMQVFKNLNAGRISTLHCCYLHAIDGVAIFIGVCKLKDVFDAPDAVTNDKWIEATRSVTYDLFILGITEHVLSARDIRYGYVKQHGFPACNVGARQVAAITKRVRCVETGVIYDNQVEAAKAVDGQQGNMSNHLRGLKGFNSVKGFTFVYDYSAPEHPSARPMKASGMEVYKRESRDPGSYMPPAGETPVVPVPRGDV